jgi:endonuclease-3
MSATTNKQQQLTQVLTILKKKFAVPPPAETPRPVLEEVLFAIVREGVPPQQAESAYAKLRSDFHDWNEVRVSSVQEVTDSLAELPEAGTKAKRIIDFLQEHFERTYSFTLEDLEKKGLKQAGKQLDRYKDHGVTDFAVAWVTQRSFGGHALPMDEPTLRVLARLHVVEGEVDDVRETRTSLERFVPKAGGPDFTDRIVQLAVAICTPEHPDCPHCPLLPECPTGQANVQATPKKKPTKPKAK